MVYNWDDKEGECYRLYVEEKQSLDEVISYWEVRGFTPRYVPARLHVRFAVYLLHTPSLQRKLRRLHSHSSNDVNIHVPAKERSRRSSRYASHSPSAIAY
jgi:hypothetical protein